MRRVEYDRQKAKEYAKKWAYSRNPRYYNFDSVGGDCTSFVYMLHHIRMIHITEEYLHIPSKILDLFILMEYGSGELIIKNCQKNKNKKLQNKPKYNW